MKPSTKSVAMTEGIRVSVESRYLPKQSNPRAQRYAFAYHVRIENLSARTVRLMTRHWYVDEEGGELREVEGDGVIGQMPLIPRGERFEYTSGAVLTRPRGSMRGSYRMHRDDGSSFEATIAPFSLELPYSIN